MIQIVIFAALCAVCTMILVAPIAVSRKKTAYILISLVPALSLGVYIVKGSPGLPSQPVMFDTNDERKAMRNIVKDELEAMKSFYDNQEDKEALMHLASLQIAQGKFDEATSHLERGLKQWKDDRDLKLQLSAAHFAKGLLLVEKNHKVQALQSLYKAQEKAPEGAPFLEDLTMFTQELEKMTRETQP